MGRNERLSPRIGIDAESISRQGRSLPDTGPLFTRPGSEIKEERKLNKKFDRISGTGVKLL